MEVKKTQRMRFFEVAKDIYAVITPGEEMDISDAGMMNNFSNSAYINRGDGLVCDTFFDPAYAKELCDFCIEKSGHAPKYVVNTHGHWDHFWGNQAFENAQIIAHRDILKDCANDKSKVPVFKLLCGSKGVQKLIGGIMSSMFKKQLPKGEKAKFLVSITDHDFDLNGVQPKLPTTLFDDDYTIELGSTAVRLINFGAVHSSSDTVVWLPGEKVLFAGDIFADCSLPQSIAAGKRWLEVMDYILDELRPELIVPGHGEVYDRERAESQRAYFRSLITQIEENYSPKLREDELIAKIDVKKYIDRRPRLGWVMSAKMMAAELKKKK